MSRQRHPYARPPLPPLEKHERPGFIHQRTLDEMSVGIFYAAIGAGALLLVLAVLRYVHVVAP